MKDIYYQEERQYVSDRLKALFLFVCMAFAYAEWGSGTMASKAMLTAFVLLLLLLFSIGYYYWILRYPDALVDIRKYLLIFIDLAVLGFLIIEFDASGLFFLPIYILIVMRSGLSFGIPFFYASLFFSALSWLWIVGDSTYWRTHHEIIATFAVTTFFIPFFYIQYITRVHEENRILAETLDEVFYDATYDALTGVANRKQYKETIAEWIASKTPFSLLFIDLNKFKTINDTHGHQAGDEVLKEVTRRLSGVLDEGDFIGRLGGDEFVIMTRRKKNYMKKFIAKLEKHVIGVHRIDKVIVPIEISIGISYYPEDAHEEMMLAKYADEAMYYVKQKRGVFHCFYHTLQACLDERSDKEK